MSKYFHNQNSFLEPNVKQYGSHHVMTNVSKSTRNTIINIDTRYKDETTYSSATSAAVKPFSNFSLTCTPAPSAPQPNANIPYYVGTNTSSNCNITLPDRINGVINMTVCNAEIPMSFYNISSALGNTCFKITNLNNTPNEDTIIQIPEGEYNQSTLVTAINQALIAASLGEFTISIVNGKTTIMRSSYTIPMSIRFDIMPNGSIDKFHFKHKLGWLLGFRKTNYFLPASADGGSIVSESLVDLNGIRYAYLVIDEFTKNSENTFVSNTNYIGRNILAKISFNKQLYPFGTVQHMSKDDGYLLSTVRSYGGKIDLQKINVQLVDELGVPIDLNGNDFMFSLMVEHEE